MTTIKQFVLAHWAPVICVFLLALRLLSIPLYPLTDRTESRYGEIARVMYATGNWVIPQLSPGEPFWAKPPLSTWCQAAGIEGFGLNEFALRFPAWMAVVVTVILVWKVACAVGGKLTGRVAAVVYAGAPITIFMAGGIMTDPYMVCGLTIFLWGTIQVLALPTVDPSKNRPSTVAQLAIPVGLSMGVLSKGPIAVILAVAPLGMLVFTDSGRKALRRGWWLRSVLLFSILTVPWFVLAEIRSPGFWNYFFMGEHYYRFVLPSWSGDLYGKAHPQPHGLIWAFFLLAMLPWLPGGFVLGWRQRRVLAAFPKQLLHDPLRLFLVASTLIPLFFFTAASNILITYVFPALPASSVLFALLVSHDYRENKSVSRSLMWPEAILAVIAVIAVIILPFIGPDFWAISSQKPVVERLGGRQAIYAFKTKHLYSARYYSQGSVRTVADSEDSLWNAVLEEPGNYYIITKKNDTYRLSRYVRNRLKLVHDFNKRYQIWELM